MTTFKKIELKVNYTYIHFTGVLKESYSVMTMYDLSELEAREMAVNYHNQGVMNFSNIEYLKAE